VENWRHSHASPRNITNFVALTSTVVLASQKQ
jgi:hypothetical protein